MKERTDWKSIDWTLPTGVIAAQTGRSQGRVSGARRLHAPGTLYITRKPGSGRKPICDWSKVDWSLPNWRIAAAKKVTESCVSNQRSIHAPHTLRVNKQHTKTDWSKVDWSLPNSIIQGMFHVCEDTVRNNRRKYA